MGECPFCDRIAAGEYETGLYDYGRLIGVAFQPLNPVTQGHRLYVTAEHVSDATADPALTGRLMAEAAHHTRDFYQVRSFNLITSAGSAATQTVRHLHVHAIPRREGDGLHLPWTGQQQAAAEAASAPARPPSVAAALDCGHEAGAPENEHGVRLHWCATCRRLREQRAEVDHA